jgi:hypothetical protein
MIELERQQNFRPGRPCCKNWGLAEKKKKRKNEGACRFPFRVCGRSKVPRNRGAAANPPPDRLASGLEEVWNFGWCPSWCISILGMRRSEQEPRWLVRTGNYPSFHDPQQLPDPHHWITSWQLIRSPCLSAKAAQERRGPTERGGGVNRDPTNFIPLRFQLSLLSLDCICTRAFEEPVLSA